jgi:hypothetical protein
VFEDGIASLGEGGEGRVPRSEALGGGAEEGETRDKLKSVGAATHQLVERNAAGELLADGAGDFIVAGPEERVSEVIARFRQIADRVGLGRRRTAETFDLREDVPDPVTGFASPANLRQRDVVTGRDAGLGFVKAFKISARALPRSTGLRIRVVANLLNL